MGERASAPLAGFGNDDRGASRRARAARGARVSFSRPCLGPGRDKSCALLEMPGKYNALLATRALLQKSE